MENMADNRLVEKPILLFLIDLNDKVDVMKQDCLVSLCISFIDEVEIYDAKKIFFVFHKRRVFYSRDVVMIVRKTFLIWCE